MSALCFSKHTKPKYNDNHYWHATKQSKSCKQLAPKAWLRAIMVTALLWQPREHSGHIANAIRVLDSRTRPLLVLSLNINPPEAQTLNREEMPSGNHQSLTPPDQNYQSVAEKSQVSVVFLGFSWCLLYVSQNIPNPNTTTTTTGMPQNRVSPANNSLQRLGSGRSWSLLCSGSQESTVGI